MSADNRDNNREANREESRRDARRESRAGERHPLQVMVRQALLLALPFWLLGAGELSVRLIYGNGLPEGRIFSSDADGNIRLWSGHKARIRLVDGTTFRASVDARGLRADSISDDAFKAALANSAPTSADAPSGTNAEGAAGTQVSASEDKASPEGSKATAHKPAGSGADIQVSSSPSAGPPHSVTIQGVTVIDGTPTPVPADGIPAVTLAPVVTQAPQHLEAMRAIGPVLLIGSELAFGWGVNDDETLASALQTEGLPVLNAAVPGFGVSDALAWAERLLKKYPSRTLVLVLHEADDWERVQLSASERLRAADGWLRPRMGRGVEMPVPSSLANRLFALYHLSMPGARPLLTGRWPDFPPAWLSRPSTFVPESQLLGTQIESFAEAHDSVRMIVAYVPSAFSLSESRCRRAPWWDSLEQAGARPWNSQGLRELLRRALRPDIQFADLSEKLSESDYLPEVPWLTPAGQAKLAGLLKSAIQETPPELPAGDLDAPDGTPSAEDGSTPTPPQKR